MLKTEKLCMFEKCLKECETAKKIVSVRFFGTFPFFGELVWGLRPFQ